MTHTHNTLPRATSLDESEKAASDLLSCIQSRQDSVQDAIKRFLKYEEEHDSWAMDIADQDEVYHKSMLQNLALNRRIRGSWHDVDAEEKPNEYCIDLAVGPQYVRIIGKMERDRNPVDAVLQYGEGYRWITYTPPCDPNDYAETMTSMSSALLAFAKSFDWYRY